MTKHKKADEARKGLIDSVKGKVKEVAGAITGNDSLTAEGQLEQTQAKERKEANSVEAVADAEAEQARAQVAEARSEGAQDRVAVNAQTAAVERSVREQQADQKRRAEQAGQQRSFPGEGSCRARRAGRDTARQRPRARRSRFGR